MKLLVASDFFYPHWTGIVKSIYDLTRSLAHEVDVSVITVRYHEDLPAEERVQGVRILRDAPLLQISRASYAPRSIIRFFKEVRAHDAVLINSPCTNILPFALLTWLFGKRLVVFHQGDLVLGSGIMNRIIELIFRTHTLIAMLLADRVSSYTEDYARQSVVLRYFTGKFQEIRMPVLLGERSNKPSGKLWKMVRFRKEERALFGFAGRFVHEKGFDILFQAIPEILKELPDAHFFFAGETNIFYEDFFEKQKSELARLKKHITLVGLLGESELHEFYTLIDIFLLPSRTECFGLVQAEAALCGKPLVVANIPGARELVRRTRFGILFETENSSDLARAAVEAYRRRTDLAKNYHRVQDMFDSEAVLGSARELLAIPGAAGALQTEGEWRYGTR